MKEYTDTEKDITEGEGVSMYLDMLEQAAKGDKYAEIDCLDLYESKDAIFLKALNEYRANGGKDDFLYVP
jgi:hypothetical protein